MQILNEGNAAIQAIGVDLYNRKITFGEANKRIQELGNSFSAKAAQIRKQYETELATQQAAEAQRQAAAQQQAAQQQAYADAQRARRAALILNYMRRDATPTAFGNAGGPIPPSYTTNCSTVGNSTN